MQEQEDNEEEDAPPDELIRKMEEILMDSTKLQSIQDAARKSVGMEISDIDLINVDHFSNQVVQLVEYRKELQEYLRSKMKNVAPNLAALIGDVVGARLISHAGSLTKLAKYPASTVQILGAEKALFRALKTKGNTPKYGLLFHSTFIGRATAKNKGRISRFLANKCSIASRIDAFSDTPNNIFGEKLKEQVEERLKMYEDGETPRKNIDVMQEALKAVKDAQGDEGEKKAEKRKLEEPVPDAETDEPVKKKKKKKKAKTEEEAEPKSTESAEMETESAETETPKKKKKKKQKTEEAKEEPVTEEPMETETVDSETPKKKKKKKKAKSDEEASQEVTSAEAAVSEEVTTEDGEKKKKKKKKKK